MPFDAVVVLVAVADRRIVPALRFVSRMPHAEAWALHVSVDMEDARQLAHDWMDLGLSWLPLRIEEAADDGLLASLRRILQQERNVTVVIPELVHRRWWHPFLHRRSARRIADNLQELPGVTVVMVPSSVVRRSVRPAYEARSGAAGAAATPARLRSRPGAAERPWRRDTTPPW